MSLFKNTKKNMKNNNNNKNTKISHPNMNVTPSFSSEFKPHISYNNSLLSKSNALKDNIGKSGVYMWVNIIDNKCYIGSSVNLHIRLREYYNRNYLNRKVLIGNSNIYKALLLHGYDNFNLEILEYCGRNCTIKREQYYLDLFKPQYNILTKAGSSLGFKHSTKTLLNFKHRKLSSEALANIKKSKTGFVPSSGLREINHLLATGHITSIRNIKNNSIKTYSSIRAAARDIGTNHTSLLNYIKNKRLYKKTFLITRKTKD
jgi:group I intron endonuclease